MKMKRRFLVLSCLIFCGIFFSGCKQQERDNNHAIVEITTSSGKAVVFKSYNVDSVGYKSGSSQAIAKAYRMELKGNNDTVNIHFFCETCGYDELYEAGVPTAKLFSCQCPEEREEGDISVREYFCIKIRQK